MSNHSIDRKSGRGRAWGPHYRPVTLPSKDSTIALRPVSAQHRPMRGFMLRFLIIAAGLWLATAIVPGIEARSLASLVWAALVLGVVNALVRPFVVILTLPITLLTLGGFLLVINAGMLALVGWLLQGFTVAGFFSALFGSIVISLTSWFAASLIGPRGRYEVLVVRRH
jgi:putative membrane protein